MIPISTVKLIMLSDLFQRTVNNELKKVKVWLDVNKLSLNIDKTNFIIFKSTQSISKLETFPSKRPAMLNS